MSGAVVGPVLAAAIGLLLSYVEVYNKRGAMPRKEVAGWVIFRLSIDSSICAATFPAAALMVHHGQWYWASVASGVGAPILLRSQVKFVGKAGKTRDYGPERLYGKLRDWIDGKIDRTTSSADSAWVINEAAPKVAKIPTSRLRARIEGYYKLLERASGSNETSQLTYLKKMFNAPAVNETTMLEAIIFQLLFYGHREFVEGLITESEALILEREDLADHAAMIVHPVREAGGEGPTIQPNPGHPPIPDSVEGPRSS